MKKQMILSAVFGVILFGFGLVLNEQGGCRDDILVYCLEEDEYLMVCNASNRLKLLQHFAANKGDLVFKMDDQTTSTAMVALQGPKVMDLVSNMLSANLAMPAPKIISTPSSPV